MPAVSFCSCPLRGATPAGARMVKRQPDAPSLPLSFRRLLDFGSTWQCIGPLALRQSNAAMRKEIFATRHRMHRTWRTLSRPQYPHPHFLPYKSTCRSSKPLAACWRAPQGSNTALAGRPCLFGATWRELSQNHQKQNWREAGICSTTAHPAGDGAILRC